MTKLLQRKFVFTAMTAVSILIVILLGTINIANIVMVRNETQKTLLMISKADGNFERIEPPRDLNKMTDAKIRPKDERDKFLSSNFFIVKVNADREIIFTDVSRTSSVDEGLAQELALKVIDEASPSGKSGKYRYIVGNSRNMNETVVVFLDTSEEILSYARVLLLSTGIGLACWIFMLIIVSLLSKKAIRPIAENIEKQKQFVTNAGHEIKTPLAIILANTQAMELYNGENKWSKNISQQTLRLNDIMKNLLDLAKMDEGSEETEKSQFSLTALLNDSIGKFAEVMKLRGIVTKAEIDDDVVIKANEQQIIQLIDILLDNASKYTNENGTVSILLSKTDKHAKLIIKNTCDKLPDAPPQKLFDRFYRDDKARNQKSGGYGIGLSMAQSIVQANKASITAEYENQNLISFIVKI